MHIIKTNERRSMPRCLLMIALPNDQGWTIVYSCYFDEQVKRMCCGSIRFHSIFFFKFLLYFNSCHNIRKVMKRGGHNRQKTDITLSLSCRPVGPSNQPYQNQKKIPPSTPLRHHHFIKHNANSPANTRIERTLFFLLCSCL